MKGKLKIVLVAPILLVVLAAAYMFVLKPKKASASKPPKVTGTLVQLPTDFVVNLADGHYGKISVALLMTAAPAPAADGTIPLPEGAEIRAIITDDLTGVESTALVDRTRRHALQQQLLTDLKAHTDEPITKVLFTDLAVQ